MSVDSCSLRNAYRALTEANPEAVRIEQAADVLALPVVVYAELLAGFEHGSRKAQNLALLERFLAQPGIELLEITRHTASFYARVYASVRARGKMIPQNDLLPLSASSTTVPYSRWTRTSRSSRA